MYCSKCGKEIPNESQLCSSCSTALIQSFTTAEQSIVKTSGLTIDSFVKIGRSGSRITGRGFAIVEIIILIVVFILALGIIMPVLLKNKDISRRITCGRNLYNNLGNAMFLYSNDYEGEFPRAGSKDTQWGPAVLWNAPDRFQAYNLQADGSSGFATISSSLYLLVKYYGVSPKSFVCPGDSGAREFRLSDYPITRGKEIKDLWDFGPIPQKHCSYSYHIPYGIYALTSSSEPEMAIAADRNPWIATPSKAAKTPFTNFKPDIPPWNGTVKQAIFGNTITHGNSCQIVLFVDAHVDSTPRAYCGINDDNIYTFVSGGVGHPQLGEPTCAF